MTLFIILAFLFSMGSMLGWGLEVFYRRFVSQGHWVNPGFLVGPCLPLYGFSLCLLYLLAMLEPLMPLHSRLFNKLLLFVLMALAITLVEYFAGVIFIRHMNIKLWDYSEQWGNVGGIICPLYSFFWLLLSAGYYFLIHPHILRALAWLAENLAFSFAIGFFFGIFVIDLVYSAQLMVRIRQYAAESGIIVRLEELRDEFRTARQQHNMRGLFFLSLHSSAEFFKERLEAYRLRLEGYEKPSEKLRELAETLRSRVEQNKNE